MKPNVILINCDDLGYGDLGCYGSTKNDTPFIDRLAAEGRKFNDFYMASPVCSPSRGSMLTGCYPPRVGFGSFHGYWVLFPGFDIGLDRSEITIGDVMKSAGYKTMAIGKWHCGDQEEFLPTNHGFDDYYGLPYSNDMCQTETMAFPPLPLIHGTEVIQQQPDQRSLTERYTEKSIEFIRQNRENPFFLYLAHMHVHLPLYAEEQFCARSRNGDYGACVMELDWSTHAIVDALKRYGVYENTIIIFTSDNGSRNDFGESNGILRGTKGQTWEGGQRVPFIVHWAGHVKPGESNELICSLDLLPSLAAIAGGEVPSDRIIDGVDQSAFMLGETEKSAREYFCYYLGNSLEAIRWGRWKLHFAKPRGAGIADSVHESSETMDLSRNIDKDVPISELYDLVSDPSEQHDVYAQHPEIVAKIEEIAKAVREDLGDTTLGIEGKNLRPIGRVENAKPLTEYDENHPYIITMYDKTEAG